MLNNVKNFVISKKEAFKVGYDPSIMYNVILCTGIGCAIGTTISFLYNVIKVIYEAIKEGEFKILVKEALERKR